MVAIFNHSQNLQNQVLTKCDEFSVFGQNQVKSNTILKQLQVNGTVTNLTTAKLNTNKIPKPSQTSFNNVV